jgi:hypothetical protein
MGPECSPIGPRLALDVHSQLDGRLCVRSRLSHVPYGLRLPCRSESVPCLVRTGDDVSVPHAEPSTYSADSCSFLNAYQAICRTTPDDCTTESVIRWAANPVESAGHEAQLESFAALEYAFQEVSILS